MANMAFFKSLTYGYTAPQGLNCQQENMGGSINRNADLKSSANSFEKLMATGQMSAACR